MKNISDYTKTQQEVYESKPFGRTITQRSVGTEERGIYGNIDTVNHCKSLSGTRPRATNVEEMFKCGWINDSGAKANIMERDLLRKLRGA